MSENVDICIVGGGIVGLFAASQLARQGFTIRLIDKTYIGSSRDNVDHVSLNGHPKGLHDFAKFCHGAWQRAAGDLNCDIGLLPVGSLMLAHTEEEVARLKRDHESATKQNEISQWSEDITAMADALGKVTLSEEALAGRLMSEDMLVDTTKALDNTRKMLIQQGVRIWGQDTVESFLCDKQGNVKGVTTDSGETCLADHTIICTGASTPKILDPLGVRLPIRPARCHILELTTSAPMPIPYITKLMPRGVLRMRKMSTGRMLVAYDGLLEQNAAVYNTKVDEHIIQWMRLEAGKILPKLHNTEISNTRVVIQAITPDFIPYIGSYENKKGLLLAVGMSGRSYAFAAGVAEVMKSIVLGEDLPLDITRLKADRFVKQKIPALPLQNVLPTYVSEEEEVAQQKAKKQTEEPVEKPADSSDEKTEDNLEK